MQGISCCDKIALRSKNLHLEWNGAPDIHYTYLIASIYRGWSEDRDGEDMLMLFVLRADEEFPTKEHSAFIQSEE